MDKEYKPRVLTKDEAVKLISEALESSSMYKIADILNQIEPVKNRYYDIIEDTYIIETKLSINKD